jgi:hypothetical protein
MVKADGVCASRRLMRLNAGQIEVELSAKSRTRSSLLAAMI